MPKNFRRKDFRFTVQRGGSTGMTQVSTVSLDGQHREQGNWFTSRGRCEMRTRMAAWLVEQGWSEVRDA